MNTFEFEMVIISTILTGIHVLLETSSISSKCSSFKCFRNSSSSMLLRL